MKRGSKSQAGVGSVRIIAGEWRGRRLPVADIPGLRPTAARSRETIFNWLQPYIVGARCLDMFAGSGALGFEAASRGARSVCLIEKNIKVYKQLQNNIEILKTSDKVVATKGDSLIWLRDHANEAWDIVFVDPPWNVACQEQVLELLLEPPSASHCGNEKEIRSYGALSAQGLVYMESPLEQKIVIPSGFIVHKEKVIGMARMHLLKLRDQ